MHFIFFVLSSLKWQEGNEISVSHQLWNKHLRERGIQGCNSVIYVETIFKDRSNVQELKTKAIRDITFNPYTFGVWLKSSINFANIFLTYILLPCKRLVRTGF